HTSVWEGAIRAKELEEQEAHKDGEYEPERFTTREQDTDFQREEDEPEGEERWDSALERDVAGLSARQRLEIQTLGETLDPDRESVEAWSGEPLEHATGEGPYDSVLVERQTGDGIGAAPWAAGIDPFPTTPTLAFLVNERGMMSAFAPVLRSPVRHLCAALVDLTG